jgi:hypothetical protein
MAAKQGDRQLTPRERISPFDIVYFVLVIFAVVLIRDLWLAPSHITSITYSEFRVLLDKGKIKDVQIGPTKIVLGAYTKPGGRTGSALFNDPNLRFA